MELAEPFAMSQPAISKHLKVLERAGLISRGRDAQRRPCRLEARPLAEANDWLERYREIWEGNFSASTRCWVPCRPRRTPTRRTNSRKRVGPQLERSPKRSEARVGSPVGRTSLGKQTNAGGPS